jgi:hypothetical protein
MKLFYNTHSLVFAYIKNKSQKNYSLVLVHVSVGLVLNLSIENWRTDCDMVWQIFKTSVQRLSLKAIATGYIANDSRWWTGIYGKYQILSHQPNKLTTNIFKVGNKLLIIFDVSRVYCKLYDLRKISEFCSDTSVKVVYKFSYCTRPVLFGILRNNVR